MPVIGYEDVFRVAGDWLCYVGEVSEDLLTRSVRGKELEAGWCREVRAIGCGVVGIESVLFLKVDGGFVCFFGEVAICRAGMEALSDEEKLPARDVGAGLAEFFSDFVAVFRKWALFRRSVLPLRL